MHITPPVTAEGYDGSHHPRCAEYTTNLGLSVTSSTIDHRAKDGPDIVHKEWLISVKVLVTQLMLNHVTLSFNSHTRSVFFFFKLWEKEKCALIAFTPFLYVFRFSLYKAICYLSCRSLPSPYTSVMS